MSEIELKPCPFCGGEALPYRRERFVCCSDDECPGWAMNNVSAEAWNRRADQASLSAVTAENDRLREAIETADPDLLEAGHAALPYARAVQISKHDVWLILKGALAHLTSEDRTNG